VHRQTGGFGGGPHRCPGSHLVARMELTVIVGRIGSSEISPSSKAWFPGYEPEICFSPARRLRLRELPLRFRLNRSNSAGNQRGGVVRWPAQVGWCSRAGPWATSTPAGTLGDRGAARRGEIFYRSPPCWAALVCFSTSDGHIVPGASATVCPRATKSPVGGGSVWAGAPSGGPGRPNSIVSGRDLPQAGPLRKSNHDGLISPPGPQLSVARPTWRAGGKTGLWAGARSSKKSPTRC